MKRHTDTFNLAIGLFVALALLMLVSATFKAYLEPEVFLPALRAFTLC